ncbi:MAG: hypothetical protein ACLR23_14915 [Clostridia bacterium]
MQEEVERRAIAISLTAGKAHGPDSSPKRSPQHFGRSGKNGGRP